MIPDCEPRMSTPQREYLLARRTRFFVFVACRAGAILLIILGSIQTLQGLLLYLQSRGGPPPGVPGAVEAYWFFIGLIQLVPGIILALGTEGLSRWIAPAPEFRCLRCDYDAGKSGSRRCPECGAPLGVEGGDEAGPDQALQSSQ